MFKVEASHARMQGVEAKYGEQLSAGSKRATTHTPEMP